MSDWSERLKALDAFVVGDWSVCWRSGDWSGGEGQARVEHPDGGWDHGDEDDDE